MKRDRQQAQEMLMKHDTSRNWALLFQRNQLMETQPHISVEDLRKIQVPVLVLSGDRDLIREEHSLLAREGPGLRGGSCESRSTPRRHWGG